MQDVVPPMIDVLASEAVARPGPPRAEWGVRLPAVGTGVLAVACIVGVFAWPSSVTGLPEGTGGLSGAALLAGLLRGATTAPPTMVSIVVGVAWAVSGFGALTTWAVASIAALRGRLAPAWRVARATTILFVTIGLLLAGAWSSLAPWLPDLLPDDVSRVGFEALVGWSAAIAAVLGATTVAFSRGRAGMVQACVLTLVLITFAALAGGSLIVVGVGVAGAPPAALIVPALTGGPLQPFAVAVAALFGLLLAIALLPAGKASSTGGRWRMVLAAVTALLVGAATAVFLVSVNRLHEDGHVLAVAPYVPLTVFGLVAAIAAVLVLGLAVAGLARPTPGQPKALS